MSFRSKLYGLYKPEQDCDDVPEVQMKVILKSAVLFCLSSALAHASSKLQKSDFTTWPRAGAKEFGCFLEKEFAHKDRKFNCSLKKYTNQGDPCKKVDEYAEGPKFPAGKAGKVDPRIKNIDLTWEHGLLQNVSVQLEGGYLEDELRKEFKLPENASIQNCNRKSCSIELMGFDHMGAGDVECPGNP